MMRDKRQILIVDDEANFRDVLAGHLILEGYEVHHAESAAAGVAYLREHYIDIVLTDLKMGDDDAAGMAVLRASLADDATRPVVMITGYATIASAVEAMKLGAFEYLTKPFDGDRALAAVVAKALRTRDVQRRQATSDPALSPGQEGTSRFGIRTRSPAMRGVLDTLARAADTLTTVLVTGETGTGKELVAHALHEHSRRQRRPFVAVNCSALPRDLVEDELFGHEKDSFTGAKATRKGKFEIADGGTIFLDEIGEMPLEMQAKLLRVLQERQAERIGQGKNAPIPVNVRVVAATNRDLRREIEKGAFREDLFYRLNVVTITLPPLRERREDIPMLVEHFMEKLRARVKPVDGIEEAALERLSSHAWPGNVRELENVIERAMIFADGSLIRLAHLPPELQDTPPTPDSSVSREGGIKDQLQRLKRSLVEAALQQTGGNVTAAAKLLGMSRKGLQNLKKDLGLR
jgi:DNA-binding NtrC family response regulator